VSLKINNLKYQSESFEYTNFTNGLLTADLIYAGLGSEDNFSLINSNGKIVLIDRGIYTFKEKVDNASINGALGVIIANNEPGLITGTLNLPSSLPVLGIAQEDGEALKLLLTSNISLNAEMTVQPTNITVKNGTSFAVPYISAAGALLYSLDPELSNNDVRTILTRTATDLNETGRDIYTGFGLLNISFALETLNDSEKPSIIVNTEISNSENLIVKIDSFDDTSIFLIEIAISSQNEDLKYYKFHYQGYKYSKIHVETEITDDIIYPLVIQVSSEDVTGKKSIVEETIIKTDSGLITSTTQSSSQTTQFTIIFMPLMIGIYFLFRKINKKAK
jgi:hypothetical protein